MSSIRLRSRDRLCEYWIGEVKQSLREINGVLEVNRKSLVTNREDLVWLHDGYCF